MPKNAASVLGITSASPSKACPPYGVLVKGSQITITNQQDLEGFAKPNPLIDTCLVVARIVMLRPSAAAPDRQSLLAAPNFQSCPQTPTALLKAQAAAMLLGHGGNNGQPQAKTIDCCTVGAPLKRRQDRFDIRNCQL